MAKPFPRLVIDEAWKRANGCCECEHDGHGHSGRCNVRCVKPMMGGRNKGGWEAHHIDPNGELTADNCLIMCMDCHKACKEQGL